MGAALPLLLSLLGGCVQEAVDTEPCPDLGDGGYEVVEGEVGGGEGFVCLDIGYFGGATMDVKQPAPWAGYLALGDGYPTDAVGSTFACASEAFPRSFLSIGDTDFELVVQSGATVLHREDDSASCGTLEIADVVLVSTELGSALRLPDMALPLSCDSNCGLD